MPILGHLLAIPSTSQEYFFYEQGKIYGVLFSMLAVVNQDNSRKFNRRRYAHARARKILYHNQ